jgi:hypothetical protein
MALWRRCNRRDPDPAWSTWLRDRIVEALPVSLTLANDLYYYWSTPQYGPVRDGYEELRAAVRAAAQSTYRDAPGLLRAMSIDTEFELTKLVRPPARDARFTLTAPADWAWLAAPILEAAECEPTTVLALLIPLVGSIQEVIGDPSTRRTYTLDRQGTAALFGERLPQCLQLLASDTLTEPWWHPEAREQAQNWLDERAGAAKD